MWLPHYTDRREPENSKTSDALVVVRLAAVLGFI